MRCRPRNEAAFSPADLGLTGSPEEPTQEQLIRWARGEDLLDEDFNPATTVRNAMGDPLHSQPAAVVYGGSETSPEVVVFAATNDGYVHAIDGATGEELWAFIPREHLPNLVKLFFDPEAQFKNYGVDGDIVPVVADLDRDGQVEPGDGDFVHIVFGMRRGGDSYYALDVTVQECAADPVAHQFTGNGTVLVDADRGAGRYRFGYAECRRCRRHHRRWLRQRARYACTSRRLPIPTVPASTCST